MASRFARLLRLPASAGAASLLLIVLLAAPPARGQSGDLSGFAFLRMAPSARAAALSGAFSAVYDGDVSGFFYNPALLSQDTHNALSLSYLNHLSDINAGFLAYGRHLGGLGTLGGGLRFISFGALEGRDENGLEEGTFHAGDVALTLGWGRAFSPRLRLGASLHAAYAGIESASATVLAGDLGVLYHLPDQQLTLSASVSNLGVALDRFHTAGVDLPVDVRLSVAKRLRHLPLLLSASGYHLHDFSAEEQPGTAVDRVLRHLALGLELQPVEALQVRLGYSHRRQQALRQTDRLDLAGLSVGFGLRISRLRFGYAYSSWSALGGLHQFTLRTRL